MFNIDDENDLNRLVESIEDSRRNLEPFRRTRVEVLKEYVGLNYSGDGTKDRVPINLIKLASTVYSRILAPGLPKVMVKTMKKPLKHFARTFELNMNHVLEDIGLEKTLKRVVLEALLGFGCVKVGLTAKEAYDEDSLLHDSDETFVDIVSLDDWVHDTSAKSFEECQFMGNKYRVSLDWAKSSELFDEETRSKLMPDESKTINEDGGERGNSLTNGERIINADIEDMVTLWDIWLPGQNIVVTLPALEGSFEESVQLGGVLRTVEWDGPKRGPYEVLSFMDVPDNAMPQSPASDWLDLHALGNRLFRKLGNQGERQKTLLLYQKSGAGDANRIKKADDGEIVASDNPATSREAKFGGIDQGNMAFLVFIRDLFSYVSGNIDALAGLSPQADTLGQDKLLTQAANAISGEMKKRSVSFVGNIIHAVSFYEWENPDVSRELNMVAPGFPEISIPVRYSYDQREGNFLDYNFTISPYSMQDDTPGTRLQTFMMFFREVLMPLMPTMQQQGIAPNAEGIVKFVAKHANMEEDLEDILIFQNELVGPEREVVGGMGANGGMPANTTRNYVRRSVPQSSQRGTNMQMFQAMMGQAGEKGGSDAHPQFGT